ncbi:MAG: 50S ribosomal protein L21 [Phycisphaeraceae bacterium]|nr:50S ribosomal protein L21 [Phycisphaeraceae bacterium]
MYAIIEESGGQRTVRPGEEILIDLHSGGACAVGDAVTFDRVLLVGGEGEARIGRPHTGAKVTAEVVEPVVFGDKIHIWKYKAKKDSKRHTGHRQRYTKVRITGIAG